MPVICTFCSSPDHTKFYCPLKPRTALKRGRIAKVGKQGYLWMETRAAWLQTHQAERYYCHYCSKPLTLDELTLDHLQARSRAPELRYVLDNLVPCCARDNRLKGSRSHDEYAHTCHQPV